MNKIQIIGAPFSSYVWIVRMALEEKQVPYDLVPALMRSPEVSAIHPFGKIPVMRHGDLTLCESKAIVTYIDRTFAGPKLIPDDARGAHRRWRIVIWPALEAAARSNRWLRSRGASSLFDWQTPDTTASRRPDPDNR